MTWQAVFNEVVESVQPIAQALRTGAVPSAEAAFHHPALALARDALLAQLQQRATVSALLAASVELRQQHAALMNKPELTVGELQQLGVLSGLAQVLSARALEQELTEQERFLFAVTQLSPWLQRAAESGVVTGCHAVAALGLNGSKAVNAITEKRL
ncbi:MAG TPA: hypothetical protein PLA87_05135 [Pseudomonadota bacterium]|jgi:hypothetical protein|nr:hypothetical protein [Pseudomonadota bacterium]